MLSALIINKNLIMAYDQNPRGGGVQVNFEMNV